MCKWSEVVDINLYVSGEYICEWGICHGSSWNSGNGENMWNWFCM